MLTGARKRLRFSIFQAKCWFTENAGQGDEIESKNASLGCG
jgi:hypothetical protein